MNIGPGNLNEEEWRELLALEYVLTHGYTKDVDKDEARLKYLRTRK